MIKHIKTLSHGFCVSTFLESVCIRRNWYDEKQEINFGNFGCCIDRRGCGWRAGSRHFDFGSQGRFLYFSCNAGRNQNSRPSDKS